MSLKRIEPLMGTYVEITAISTDKQKAESAIKQAFDKIKLLDSLTSTYKSDSEISRLNRQGKTKSSKQSLDIIKKAIYFSELTNGALDITYKPIMDLWEEARKENRLPDNEELNKAAALVNFKNISIDGNIVKFKQPGMSIDLSCIAKGYAVDEAISSLRQRGVESALVNAGGDIYALGRRSKNKLWQIGIQDPRDANNIVAKIELENKAVATSGDYERYSVINDKRYSFIFNPKSGLPVDSIMSATVIADDCATADALATASFILGRKAISLVESLDGVEAILITKGGEIIASRGVDKFITGISKSLTNQSKGGGEKAKLINSIKVGHN